jgi:hypothetical protein
MNKLFIERNKTLVSVFVFLCMFGSIVLIKPKFLYNRDGSIRQFGVGYKNKTILPIWLLSCILGILSYLIVLFYTWW